MQDLPPTAPVDGIVPPPARMTRSDGPAPSPETPPAGISLETLSVGAKTAQPKKKLNPALIVFGVIAAAYVLSALVLISLFPRPDGSLMNVRVGGSALFALTAILWLLFGVVGFLRISGIKEHPRMKMFALIRLLIMVVPMALVGGFTVLLINIPPSLTLKVVSPEAAAELISPVSVTFGMETAMKIFAMQKLTPLSYKWDFIGSGVPQQETFDPQATYLYTKAGVFSVTARVTMTDGTVKRVTRKLIIPRSSFAVQPGTPIIDEPVTFSIEHFFPKTNEQNAPKLAKAKWDFDGDGVVDYETDKLVAGTTYRKLGPVNASVVMTLTNQTQQTLQRALQVSKPPEQPFPITLETEPQTLLGPPPFGVLFVLKTKEPIANASWDFGNQKSAEGLRVAQVYTLVGNYTVNVNVRSQSGSIAKLSKIVRVTNPLELRDLLFEGKPEVKDFTVAGQVPLTVNITPVTSMPLITYSWDAPNASDVLATEKNFSAVYRDQGKYFIDLIGVDPDQNVFRKRITVNAEAAQSLVKFSMDPSAPMSPANVTFDASDTFIPSGEEITGFEWDFGDKTQSGDKTQYSGSRIEHRFEKEGTYMITLNVRTTAGKVYTGRQTLVVRAPLVDACFIPSRRSGKAPLGVRFETQCSSGEFTNWLWDFGDNAQSDQREPTHVYVIPGEFNVTLTATTRDGIKSVKTTIISVSE